MRHTDSSLKVLAHLRRIYPKSATGMDIIRATGIATGTGYPLFYRLEEKGYIKGKWEEEEPYILGHPRRCFYTLTDFGVKKSVELLLPFQMNG